LGRVELFGGVVFVDGTLEMLQERHSTETSVQWKKRIFGAISGMWGMRREGEREKVLLTWRRKIVYA